MAEIEKVQPEYVLKLTQQELDILWRSMRPGSLVDDEDADIAYNIEDLLAGYVG